MDHQTWFGKVPRLLPTVSVSLQEVESQIGHTKRKSIPGLDEISYIALTRCCDIISPHLQSLFTGILMCGFYPKQWKTSQMLNILKPGRKGDRPEHFRSIGPISCLSKILEGILAKKLSNFVQENGSLPNFNMDSGKGDQHSNPCGN